jgi:hypothetical protein
MAALRAKSLALTDLFIQLVEERCAGHGLGWRLRERTTARLAGLPDPSRGCLCHRAGAHRSRRHR